MNKTFRLSTEEIKELIPNIGGCYATEKITVLGEKVGYMYREQPDVPEDSGWRFFSGTETQEYVDDPNNTMMYSVNTIVNYDPEIIPFLEAPYNSAYGRDEHTGNFIKEEF